MVSCQFVGPKKTTSIESIDHKARFLTAGHGGTWLDSFMHKCLFTRVAFFRAFMRSSYAIKSCQVQNCTLSGASVSQQFWGVFGPETDGEATRNWRNWVYPEIGDQQSKSGVLSQKRGDTPQIGPSNRSNLGNDDQPQKLEQKKHIVLLLGITRWHPAITHGVNACGDALHGSQEISGDFR